MEEMRLEGGGWKLETFMYGLPSILWRAERHMEGKRGEGVSGSLKLSTYGGQKVQRAERTHGRDWRGGVGGRSP